MNIVKYLLALLFFSNIHASFYRETIIPKTTPFSVLDPARRPELERLVTNLRFFGNLGPRPARDVFIHHQAVQNLLVFPTSHLTALAWMLFPISPLPTINPNNVRGSDPLGKITPEALGKLIGVMGRFANPYYQAYSFADELLDIFKVFDPEHAKELLQNYSPDHNPELQEFYRYSLLEALAEHIKRNVSVDDEELNLSDETKAQCSDQPHRLVIEALQHSSSHLLEIPGTEILRSDGETFFTKDELDVGLQQLSKSVNERQIEAVKDREALENGKNVKIWNRYENLSYNSREEYKIHAAVDMLYKAAKSSPNEVLELLAFYAWRKFPEQMRDVIWASGAVNQAQYAKIREVLSAPYSRADYEAVVTAFKTDKNADDFFESLTAAQQNLLLYGGASYDSMRMQDYGNVRVLGAA